jgi:hypothetical protein
MRFAVAAMYLDTFLHASSSLGICSSCSITTKLSEGIGEFPLSEATGNANAQIKNPSAIIPSPVVLS